MSFEITGYNNIRLPIYSNIPPPQARPLPPKPNRHLLVSQRLPAPLIIQNNQGNNFFNITNYNFCSPPPSLQSTAPSPKQGEAPNPNFPFKHVRKFVNESGPKERLRKETPGNCTQCPTKISPVWRKGPKGDSLCNKCGLAYKAALEKGCTNCKEKPIVYTHCPGNKYLCKKCNAVFEKSFSDSTIKMNISTLLN